MSRNRNCVNNDDEETILERVKEDSLKYFNEVELPRLNKETPIENNGNEVNKYEESKAPSRTIWYEGHEAEGFYLAAGSTYIYPTNYPVREYQDNILKTALFKNTLVSLPTGLGKTFIAAVVMYNFYRWYPKGKIIFMAPTRPLVAQQIKACYNVMGMPIEHTTEMTGNLNVNDRVTLWKEKRVFFLTPQVMVNDIRSKSCPAKSVKCVVVDEAHRAVKDYAYCQVISLLDEEEAVYRLLALSATPGNNVNGVKQIIKNLKISALEFRGEDALDVIKYTHQKNIQSVAVTLSTNIQRVKGDFLQVYDKYAKKLRDCRAMNCNIATVSKFQVLKASEKFRANPPRGIAPSAVGSIICDFSVCMSLAHALELLQIYGLRAFCNYLSEGGDKNKAALTRLKNDTDLSKILGRLKQMLSKKPGEEGYVWGHPKLYKLTSVLTEHFHSAKEKGEKTKAIIFCQYRVVVTEVLSVLESLNSDIKPVVFIGQASNSKDRGMTQARQLEIMKNFRLGLYNCMIATCVAEEGLDIGEVDLIVLMEAHKSPIRLVQRIGRTGRKRSGKCVVLVTEGKEEYKLQEALAARKSYVSSVLNAKSVREHLNPYCPPMLPFGVKPIKQLLHIEVIKQISPEKPSTSKQVDIRSCLVPEESPFITSEEYKQAKQEINKNIVEFNKIPDCNFLFHRIDEQRMSLDELLDKNYRVFSEWNDWNLQLHEIHELSHSSESELMCGLLNRFYSFDMRFFSFPQEKSCKNLKRKRDCDNLLNNDDEEEPLITKKGKKGRKELNSVKLGMDIRQCIAVAKDKVKTQKGFDPNEIIDVDLLEPKTNFHSSKDEALIEEVIQSLEKQLQLKNSIAASTFVDPNSQFDQILKTVDHYTIASKKNCTSSLISLYGKINRNENFISKLVSELDSIKITEEDIPNIKVDCSINENNFSQNQPLEQKKKSLSNLVELDDLFVGVNEAEEQKKKSSDNVVGLDDLFVELKESPEQKKKSSDNLVELDDLFVELKQSPESEKRSSNNLVEPDNLVVKDDQFWEPIPEEFFCSKEPSKNNHNHLAASTPKNNQVSFNVAHQFESPIVNKHVWNLDDFFEDDIEIVNDESLEPNLVLIPHNFTENSGTMIGITQMVSMIEEEKRADQMLADKAVAETEAINKSRNSVEEVQKDLKKIESVENLVHFLDEDDDLFSSIVHLDSSPVKNENNVTKNNNKSFRNSSFDMFASTVNQSKFLDNTKLNVKESPKTGNTCNISDKGIVSNENILNDESLDHVIISSDEDDLIHDEFLVSQNRIKKKSDTTSATPKQNSVSHESNIKICVDNHRCTTSNFNTISEPVQESTGLEVKINPPNFKRFISNKMKTEVSNNISTSMDQTLSYITEEKSDDVSKASENINPSIVNDEGWWYEFDYPSNYPKREVKFAKTVNRKSISQQENNILSQNRNKDKNSTVFNSEIFNFKENSVSSSNARKINPCPISPIKKLMEPIANLCSENRIRTVSCKSHESDKKIFYNKNNNGFNCDSNEIRNKNNKSDANSYKDLNAFPSSNLDNSFKHYPSTEKKRSSRNHKKKRRRKVNCEFIDKEAEAESGTTSGDDSSGLDNLEESFIDDEETSVSIHAKYLQSVKSPVRGNFKIPQLSDRINMEVFSQYDCNDTEYVNDSFCVGSDESSAESELSAIEIAERKLDKKRKKKQWEMKPKRRRIRIVSPESLSNKKKSERKSDSETESPLQTDALTNKKSKFRILSDSDGTISDNSPLIINKKFYTAKSKAQQTLTKKKLNFPLKSTKINTESDNDLQQAIRESQREYLNHEKTKQTEEEQLLEAIKRSQIDFSVNNEPSTSGLSNFI